MSVGYGYYAVTETLNEPIEVTGPMCLRYFGIRVTDLERSLRFYTKLFGLKEVARGDSTQVGGGRYVLLRDRKSGQKLELNWYPEGSSYGVPYSPGEGLDHIGFRVNNVSETLKELTGRPSQTTEPVGVLGQKAGRMTCPAGDP